LGGSEPAISCAEVDEFNKLLLCHTHCLEDLDKPNRTDGPAEADPSGAIGVVGSLPVGPEQLVDGIPQHQELDAAPFACGMLARRVVVGQPTPAILRPLHPMSDTTRACSKSFPDLSGF
jgi:hypothetical protein